MPSPSDPGLVASTHTDPGSAAGGDRHRGGLSAATTVVGVIGDPVDHSRSPLLHNQAFAAMGLDWVSVGFRVREGAVDRALIGMRALGIRGLSVTMPHKEVAAALVDRKTPVAERLGAVNCITNEDGVLVGDNTDGSGFVAALRVEAGFDPRGQRCLVVGAGGAGRAVIAGLADAGASEVIVVNRSADRATAAAALAGAAGHVGQADDARRCALVVNATPVGMGSTEAGRADVEGSRARRPDGGPGGMLVDPGVLGPGQLVVDLVYHPATTPWLDAARTSGATAMNGLGMLVHQAALQIERWSGRPAPLEAMRRAVLPPTPG